MSKTEKTTINKPQTRPMVSVVCQSYNHAPYLRQTLENILTQKTDFLFEIIVHDDASTDRSQEIIRELSDESDELIRPILQTENQYSQGRRPPQFTFREARGDFIALCEGDDYWTDPNKLQKQVDALRRHPEIELCVHPAMRLSMRTGKQKKGFDHGPTERIIPLEPVIARHNQFAPTASMLMRTKAAQALPDWFFNEPGLPVGDFFIEAILGRKGVLYLPETMSVYRRDVPGSYTNRFRQSSGEELEQSMNLMLYFTEKLRGIDGMPEHAINQRIAYTRLNYALQLLASGNRERFRKVASDIQLTGHPLAMSALWGMRHSQMAFRAGHYLFPILRAIRN